MRSSVSTRPFKRFSAALLSFAAAGLLAGCASYGSFDENEPGIEESIFGDVVSIVGGESNEPQIDYTARAPLVAPPTAGSLPAPQSQTIAANDPQWPQGSNERLARVLTSEDQTLVFTPGVDGVDIEATQALAARQSRPSARRDDQNRVLTPAELEREADIQFARDEASLVRQQQGTVRQRRFLTDPPTEARAPAPDAPFGVEAEEAADEGGIDWWPF